MTTNKPEIVAWFKPASIPSQASGKMGSKLFTQASSAIAFSAAAVAECRFMKQSLNMHSRRPDMTTEMTPEQRIDAALDSILRAAGSALKHYTMPGTLGAMREAMRKVMSESYIQGSNDCYKAMMGGGEMSKFKLVSMEPTAEMVEAAEEAYMPFGDMDLAIRMAVLTAPVVQGEPVAGGPLHPSQVRALRRNVKRNCLPEIYALLDQAIAAHQPGVTQLVEALELALEYWRHRQQRYKNRRPKWVITAEDALAELERRNQQTGGGA